MVQFNTKDNEILIKIVYYGTGLSGKTTNLQKLHEVTDQGQTTDLFSVNTMEDRTLFFDLLPLDLGTVFGNTIKLQIYTVPGQVHYDSTRRIVLSGADGVVFVADSEKKKLQDNVQSINNLYHNLQANRLNIKEVPLVMQYNKRDLEDINSLEVLNQKLNFRNVPYFEAVAIKGKGVLETFVETVKLTVRYIFQKYQLTKSIKNVDSVIEKLEESLRKAPVPMDNSGDGEDSPTRATGDIASTVLKFEHEHDNQNEKSSQDKLLHKAITSNMETAQLYTQLKKSQEALVRKNKELQVLNKRVEKSNADNLKMRRFLENLVNFAGEAIITFNELWVIQNWNHAAEELFNYKRDEVLRKNINIIFPDDSISDLNRVLSYVMDGKVVRGFETRLKSKSGEAVPVNITFSPIKNQKDVIVAFTAIVRDLSFMAKIGKQLHQLQRFEAVGQLLPDLLGQLQSQVAHSPVANSVVSSLHALTSGMGAPLELCNLNDILRELHQLMTPRLKARRVIWHAQLFPSLPNFTVHRESMTRALLNIFLNALDALEDKTDGKITVGTHFAGNEIILQAIDNGVGMAQDELDRMMDPAMDEKKNTKNLRLNATREIMKEFGGMVRVDSTPGKGTKVTVRITPT